VPAYVGQRRLSPEPPSALRGRGATTLRGSSLSWCGRFSYLGRSDPRLSRGVANLGFSKLSDAACRGLSRLSDNPPFRTKSAHFEFKIGLFGPRITQLITQLGVAVCHAHGLSRGLFCVRHHAQCRPVRPASPPSQQSVAARRQGCGFLGMGVVRLATALAVGAVAARAEEANSEQTHTLGRLVNVVAVASQPSCGLANDGAAGATDTHTSGFRRSSGAPITSSLRKARSCSNNAIRE
jgi:hypothetical protein